jgi:azurin
MKLPSSLVPLAAALATALFLSACGRGEKSAAASSAVPGASANAPAAPAQGRYMEFIANDAMKFSLTEVYAKPGEALAVTLKNLGTMPKFSMGHNWVLLDSTVDVNAFAADAAQAAKTDYVPASYKAGVLATTKLLGPKETDTVRFYAPTKPGRYVFLCSFPGHFQVGMKGELIVE